MTVKQLSEELGVRARDVIHELLNSGYFSTINMELTAEHEKRLRFHFGVKPPEIQTELDRLRNRIQMLEEENRRLRNKPPIPIRPVLPTRRRDGPSPFNRWKNQHPEYFRTRA